MFRTIAEFVNDLETMLDRAETLPYKAGDTDQSDFLGKLIEAIKTNSNTQDSEINRLAQAFKWVIERSTDPAIEKIQKLEQRLDSLEERILAYHESGEEDSRYISNLYAHRSETQSRLTQLTR